MSENKKRAGMILDIYRSAAIGDCTANGVSSEKRGAIEILLIGEGVPEIFDDDGRLPVLKLVKRNLSGAPYFHCEPADNPERKWYMMGGNYAATSDGRIRALVGGPLPIHDRWEDPSKR